MDYEFSKTQLDFLRRFGDSSNGKEFLSILKGILNETDRASNIPSGGDYGAQVEGRKIFQKLVKKLTDAMLKKEIAPGISEEDLDDYS